MSSDEIHQTKIKQKLEAMRKRELAYEKRKRERLDKLLNKPEETLQRLERNAAIKKRCNRQTEDDDWD